MAKPKRPPKRFMPGDLIRSADGFMQHANQGNGWFFWRVPRPIHWTFLFNWRFGSLVREIGSGRLRAAVETPEYIAWSRAS